MAVDRSTYDKLKYNDFHLLIEILLVFMLYQSADDNLSYLRWCPLHSLIKLFSGWARLGRTCNGSGNEEENCSSISASNKRKMNINEFSKPHCLNLIAFYSKSC